jgi:hypothetical protein
MLSNVSLIICEVPLKEDMAFGLLRSKFTLSEVGGAEQRCILRGNTERQALVRSLHFLTVYSNLASDENGEQINYHNSLFLQLTLCAKLSVKPGKIGTAECCHPARFGRGERYAE